MESSTQKDNSPEGIRERVESKQDDFAGGPAPGWQTLEATVDETRHEAAQAWSSTGGDTDTASPPEQQSSTVTTDTTPGSTELPASDAGESREVAREQETYPAASTEVEAQGSIGQTGQSVGTTSAPAGAAATTGDSMARDEMPPFNDEHPLGVGQQCFMCGAYNDLDAVTCWNCSQELTPTMVETPGIVESVQPVGTGKTPDSIPIGETTETDNSGGADVI